MAICAGSQCGPTSLFSRGVFAVGCKSLLVCICNPSGYGCTLERGNCVPSPQSPRDCSRCLPQPGSCDCQLQEPRPCDHAAQDRTAGRTRQDRLAWGQRLRYGRSNRTGWPAVWPIGSMPGRPQSCTRLASDASTEGRILPGRSSDTRTQHTISHRTPCAEQEQNALRWPASLTVSPLYSHKRACRQAPLRLLLSCAVLQSSFLSAKAADQARL